MKLHTIIFRYSLLMLFLLSGIVHNISAQTTVPIDLLIEANSWDERHDSTRTGSHDIHRLKPTFWVGYHDVNFYSGELDSFIIIGGGASFELRIDSVDGPVIGSTADGKNTTDSTVAIAIKKTTGVHKIYLYITGGRGTFYAYRLTGEMTVTPNAQKTYWVANDGSDSDAGTKDKPFKTIQKAATVMLPGDKCIIRQGIYRETVHPASTGLAGYPMSFEGNPGEDVFITGTEALGGWQKHTGSIYKTPMSWSLGKGFNQVFADGEMLIEAQCPNIDFAMNFDTSAVSREHEKHRYFHPNLLFATYNLNEETRESWAYIFTDGGEPCIVNQEKDALAGALFWSTGSWWANCAYVTGNHYSADGHSKGPAMKLEMIGGTFAMPRHTYVSGVYALLDAPGEWVRHKDTLYVWMPESDNPSDHLVEARKRDFGLSLKGKANTSVKNIKFQGCLLTLEDAQNCLVDNCHFRFSAHFQTFAVRDAIYDQFKDYNPINLWDNTNPRRGVLIGGRNNTAKNCSVKYSAGSGFMLKGSGHTIDNCSITHTGYCGSYDAAVRLSGKSDLKIINNTMHTIGRSIVTGGPYIPGLKVMYNHMYNAMVSVSDGGIVYTYGPSPEDPDIDIAYNWMHDQHDDHSMVYIDMGGGGRAMWKVHHNVFWRGNGIGWRGYHGGTQYNQAWNNTIIDKAYSSKTQTLGTNDLWMESDNAKWKLTDPANMKFMPLEGSPAIDAGVKEIPAAISNDDGVTHMPAVAITDYKGSAPDLGAYEYGGENWVPGHKGWTEPVWKYPPADYKSALGPNGIAERSLASLALRVMPSRIDISLPVSVSWKLGVYDAMGRMVKFIEGNGRKSKASLSLKTLPAGMYQARVMAGNKTLVRRFLKVR